MLALTVELPRHVYEDAENIKIIQSALLLAIQYTLQDALDDEDAARAYVGNATQGASFVSGTAPETRAYTLTVGLLTAFSVGGALRRGRRVLADAVAASVALSGLFDSGYLQATFAAAGVPDSDALFSSGALALAMGTVAPPSPPPPLLGPTPAAGLSGGGAVGIAVAAVLLVLIAGAVYFYGPSLARPAAPKADLQLRSIKAAPAAPAVPAAAAYGDIDLNIYNGIEDLVQK